MAHELVGTRFVTRETPGWHRLGRTAPKGERATASQWVAEVTRGAEVVKIPLTFVLNGEMYTSDRVAIVRKPIADDNMPRQFGVASSSWNLESYAACAKVFDKLSETYPVETAGLIKHGAICFVSFKAEEWDVMGDKVVSYLVLAISMVPGVSHHVLHTPVRVVCNNTLNMAMGSANLNIKIPHEADSLQQLALSADIIEKFHTAKDRTKAIFEGMARRALRVDEAQKIIDSAYPMPVMPAQLKIIHQQFQTEEERIVYKKTLDPERMAQVALAEKRFEQLIAKTVQVREFAMERYAKFDREDLRGTAWAAYNAVTEVSDWREGRNADESLMFGSRAKEKERAFEMATALVDENKEVLA
jgi:hypothetical protein